MILSQKELIREALRLRVKRKRVITTNGCYEILHAGHIDLLNRAAKLGTLIVLLNSDKSVEAIKGKAKCLVPEEQRLIVMDALRVVSYVSLFDETTPCEILSKIRPDTHVKGGDYIAEEMPEYPIVTKYGGDVRIFPLVPELSTTNLIKRVIELNT